MSRVFQKSDLKSNAVRLPETPDLVKDIWHLECLLRYSLPEKQSPSPYHIKLTLAGENFNLISTVKPCFLHVSHQDVHRKKVEPNFVFRNDNPDTSAHKKSGSPATKENTSVAGKINDQHRFKNTQRGLMLLKM